MVGLFLLWPYLPMRAGKTIRMKVQFFYNKTSQKSKIISHKLLP